MTKVAALLVGLLVAVGSQACTVVVVERPVPVVAARPARTSSGHRVLRVQHRPPRVYAVATVTQPAPGPARSAPRVRRSAPGPARTR